MPISADPNDPELAGLPYEIRKDYVVTPAGLFHRSCVNQVDNGSTVLADGSIKNKDGSIRSTTPCQYPSFRWLPGPPRPMPQSK